jgi:3-oxoacyl-[acyl-carrier-protein] synthase III
MIETPGSKLTDHWLTLESPGPGGSWGCRIESVGVKLPAQRLMTKDLMDRTRHRTHIQLERLTGIHERHVVGPGENSFTLGAGAARDCLAHSQHRAADIEMLISTSITRSKGGSWQSFEPPLSLYVKQAIGATQAASFDLSNACAGMLTGVFILQDLVSRGEINCGMVVSGEYISHLSWNAARQIRSLFSKQLASLTLGDAGAAVIVERAPSGTPGIEVIGFTTLAEHSRLCLAFPSTVGPGAQMYTKSRELQKVAIEDMAPLVAEVIGEAGIDLSDIDYLIPHQTSARAIRQGTREFARRLGARPKHVVVNLEEYGNTSSTTLFVALHKYLEEQRMHKGDRVMLLSLASGIEIGIAIFTIDNQVDHYGRTN